MEDQFGREVYNFNPEAYNQGFQRGWDTGYGEGLEKGHLQARAAWKEGMEKLKQMQADFAEQKTAWEAAKLNVKEEESHEVGTSEVK